MKPCHDHSVRFHKSEHNNGHDVITRRPLRIVGDKTSLNAERIESLYDWMTDDQIGQPVADANHCDVREVFMHVVKSAMAMSQPEVNIIVYRSV